MNLKQLYDSLDILEGEDRDQILEILIDKYASQLSIKILHHFQDKWDFKHTSWEQFKKKQDICIKKCIEVELSDKAQDIRKKLNLQEFNWSTNII